MSLEKQINTLTRYQAGSLAEVVTISLPLMLQVLSGTLMYFLDRIILAHYDQAAMNAAASAGLVCAVFQFGTVGIAGISEVFVGQYNGSKQFKKLGIPSWQMIWFSLACNLIFVPLAFYGGPTLVPEPLWADGLPYFKWLMAFACLMPLLASIAGFFVGQGKVILVSVVIGLGNVLNLVLDVWFVFGWGPVPSMGAEGAAIATVTAMLSQVLVLFIAFLSQENRQKFGTNLFAYNHEVMRKSFRIGFPNALGHMLEIAAWAFLLHIMAEVSMIHATVITIGQSILILLIFSVEGLHKGLIAIISNMIGAKVWEKIHRALVSGWKFHFIMVVILALPLTIVPDYIVTLFLPDASAEHPTAVSQLAAEACFWVWIYFIFDGLVWTLASILTAAGDTLFVMFVNAMNAWIFAIIPAYYIVIHSGYSVSFTWPILCVYATVNTLCFYHRYQKGRWKNIKLLD